MLEEHVVKSMTHLELREIAVTDWEMIQRIGELRVRAWRTVVPQAVEMTVWLDDFDRTARHWAFLRDGEPVAAARLSVHKAIEEVPDPESYTGVFRNPPPAPIASLNRLVVDPAVRGMGLSEKLDLIRLAAAEAMGCKCVVGATAAGERRVRQMLKWGFVVVGEGKRCLNPPLCYMPPPLVLICYLPRKVT